MFSGGCQRSVFNSILLYFSLWLSVSRRCLKGKGCNVEEAGWGGSGDSPSLLMRPSFWGEVMDLWAGGH